MHTISVNDFVFESPETELLAMLLYPNNKWIENSIFYFPPTKFFCVQRLRTMHSVTNLFARNANKRFHSSFRND